MYNSSLFLGFPVSYSYADALTKIDPQILNLFISENIESYLKEVSVDGVRYVGKFVEEVLTIPDLVVLEKNIYSVLNKFVPDYPYEDVPLVLLAVPFSFACPQDV